MIGWDRIRDLYLGNVKLRRNDCTEIVNELTTRNAELVSLIAGQQAKIVRLEARIATLEAQIVRLGPRPRH